MTFKGAFPDVGDAENAATSFAVPDLKVTRGRLSEYMLPVMLLYAESEIPSPSASIAVFENPVPSGFPQKLPPM